MGQKMKCSLLSKLCEEFHLSAKQIEDMVAEGLLNPREGIFTAKERDILAILARCDEAEMDVSESLFSCSKMLAEKKEGGM